MATMLNYVDKEGLVTLWGLISAELRTKLTAEDVKSIESAVTANTAAITLLNGTGEGSVAKTVADAIAAIVAGAPEDLNTLKELSDWISGHGSDVASMNSAISANTSGLEALRTLVGVLPEGTTATNLVEYVQKLTEGLASDAGLAQMKTDIKALQDKAHTHANADVINAINANKVTAWDDAVAAQHEHANMSVLNGINADVVAKWDVAEQNAKKYAKDLVDGLDQMVPLTETEIRTICTIV